MANVKATIRVRGPIVKREARSGVIGRLPFVEIIGASAQVAGAELRERARSRTGRVS